MFYYIFSLFFIFFFVECIRTDNWALKVIYAILSIISIGLFSISWTGYIFYIGLMGIFVVVYLIACLIFNAGSEDQSQYSNKLVWLIHQKEFLSIILLIVIGAVGLAIFRGVDSVLGIFNVQGLLVVFLTYLFLLQRCKCLTCSAQVWVQHF